MRFQAVIVALGFLCLGDIACAAGALDTEAALGKALFQDKNLSHDRKLACASCHAGSKAFGDSVPISPGNGGRRGTRNAPSLTALKAYRSYFWDGRVASLEDQVRGPLLNPTEMGLANEQELLDRVRENPNYVSALARMAKRVSGQVEMADLAKAIVAYESLMSLPTRALDRYLQGDKMALSREARAGLAVFEGKAGCASCHVVGTHEAPLTDGSYHASVLGLRGVGPRLGPLVQRLRQLPPQERYRQIQTDADVAALGRYVVTLDPNELGAFRTPSLVDVGHTAPYMHDGSVPTLEDAVDLEIYYRGTELGYPLILSESEKRELIALMREL